MTASKINVERYVKKQKYWIITKIFGKKKPPLKTWLKQLEQIDCNKMKYQTTVTSIEVY